ncbi:hypothetical protein GGX14DRAFT_640123 [Mycena pura]|uniref:Uncharacterized protein n=1 Tax=Mycena pura TaxID=153505 RepID=A0AAD6YPR3_9AGAR|nr:hypothetical protein GGX14DRAFT_640123 [Mycena pura]
MNMTRARKMVTAPFGPVRQSTNPFEKSLLDVAPVQTSAYLASMAIISGAKSVEDVLKTINSDVHHNSLAHLDKQMKTIETKYGEDTIGCQSVDKTRSRQSGHNRMAAVIRLGRGLDHLAAHWQEQGWRDHLAAHWQEQGMSSDSGGDLGGSSERGWWQDGKDEAGWRGRGDAPANPHGSRLEPATLRRHRGRSRGSPTRAAGPHIRPDTPVVGETDVRTLRLPKDVEKCVRPTKEQVATVGSSERGWWHWQDGKDEARWRCRGDAPANPHGLCRPPIFSVILGLPAPLPSHLLRAMGAVLTVQFVPGTCFNARVKQIRMAAAAREGQKEKEATSRGLTF